MATKLPSWDNKYPLPTDLNLDEVILGRKRRKEFALLKKSSMFKIWVVDKMSQQNHLCYYCDTSLVNEYTVDHKKPLAKGGTNEYKNLVLACRSCNSEKGYGKLERNTKDYQLKVVRKYSYWIANERGTRKARQFVEKNTERLNNDPAFYYWITYYQDCYIETENNNNLKLAISPFLKSMPFLVIEKKLSKSSHEIIYIIRDLYSLKKYLLKVYSDYILENEKYSISLARKKKKSTAPQNDFTLSHKFADKGFTLFPVQVTKSAILFKLDSEITMLSDALKSVIHSSSLYGIQIVFNNVLEIINELAHFHLTIQGIDFKKMYMVDEKVILLDLYSLQKLPDFRDIYKHNDGLITEFVKVLEQNY